MLKIFDLPLWYSPNPGEKICFIMKIYQAIRFREKNELNFSIILSLESRNEWTVMQKKFFLPLLYFSNRGEKFFFYENFSTNGILRKNQIQFFDYYVIGIEWWVDIYAEKILLTFIVFSKSGRKQFFLYENFSTNQISRKNQIQFFDYFVIGIEWWVDSDVEKILLIFVVFSESGRKIFFLSKFFNQSDFEKKSNWIIRLFCHWNRGMSRQWCWKNSIDLCCILRSGRNIFISSKFFSQSDLEKNWNSVIRLFCDWNRAKSRQWCWKNSIDLCCILQIGEKNFFFYENFSTNEILRKNQIQFFDYFVIGIERRVDSDAEKILLIFVVFSKSGRKYFFFFKIFQPIGFRKKMELSYSIILSLESSEESTVMLKKFYWSLLYSPNRGEKVFFLWKFFNQWDFEKKSNSIFRLFCDWNPAMSRQWCWKNSIDLCCILQIGEKKFFFYQNFSTNEISRKNQIELIDYFVIGIERRVDSDAEKILLIFVVFSKSGRKIFFSMKIFQPMRFWEKIKFNFSIILWLESSDESTVMLKKFYWSLLYSPNRGEKIFFLSKFFNQWDFEKKSNWINRLFCDWNRAKSRQWCWKNSIDLCCILQIGEKIFFFLQNFSANRISKKNGSQLFDYFVIGIERWVNTDAEKIRICLCCILQMRGENIFFSIKIFQANQI